MWNFLTMIDEKLLDFFFVNVNLCAYIKSRSFISFFEFFFTLDDISETCSNNTEEVFLNNLLAIRNPKVFLKFNLLDATCNSLFMKIHTIIYEINVDKSWLNVSFQNIYKSLPKAKITKRVYINSYS